MSSYKHPLSIIIFCFILSVLSPTYAADITVGDFIKIIRLEGEIKKGDFEKLRSALKKAIDEKWVLKRKIILDSPGGDVVEAMKMGRLINKLRIMTEVATENPTGTYKGPDPESTPPNNCSSACFFIFVGGAHRFSRMFNTSQRVGDLYESVYMTGIGIHRPFFDKGYFATLDSSKAQERYKQLIDKTKKYLLEMGVGNDLIERMYRISSNKVEFLTYDEYKKSIGIYTSYFSAWINAKCENFPSLTKKDSSALYANHVWERIKSNPGVKYTDDYKAKKLSKEYVSHLNEKKESATKCRREVIFYEQERLLKDYFGE